MRPVTSWASGAVTVGGHLRCSKYSATTGFVLRWGLEHPAGRVSAGMVSLHGRFLQFIEHFDRMHTHCARRPSWEIVTRILSVKNVTVTSVGVPLIEPVADLVCAGYAVVVAIGLISVMEI